MIITWILKELPLIAYGVNLDKQCTFRLYRSLAGSGWDSVMCCYSSRRYVPQLQFQFARIGSETVRHNSGLLGVFPWVM